MIPEEDWPHYQAVLQAAIDRGVPFALGGGLAFSVYSQRPRFTKDIDLYILHRDRDVMIHVLHQAGFVDYFDQVPYDRSWIYRGVHGRAIADLIWAMANQRAWTDDAWLVRSRHVNLRGLRVLMLPAEELIWTKLYVLQRDRSDWPDLLNLLNCEGPDLDWEHLIRRVGEDALLLGAVLMVFAWMCPGRAAELPQWIWPRMGLLPPLKGPNCSEDRSRVALLDSRDWFGPSNGTVGGHA